MAYLLGRKIGFNPKGPAPFTEAKAEMQKLAKSDITLDLQAAYDAGLEPFRWPLVRVEDITWHLATDKRYQRDRKLHAQAHTFLTAIGARKLRRYKKGAEGLKSRMQLYACAGP